MDLEACGVDAAAAGRLRAVAARFGLRLLCVFGSRATGRAGLASDLDLAAWFGEPRRAQSQGDALFAAVLAALPADAPPLDLVLLDLAEPLLQFVVAREGRPLYAAGPQDFVEFSVRAAAAYRDSEKYRRGLHEWLRRYARDVRAARR